MTAKRLGITLEHASSLPQGLIAHARQLIELNHALKDRLATWGPWTQHLSLANLRPPVATLLVRNAAAATPLRYRQQELLDWLNEQTGERLTRLEITIQVPASQRGSGV